MDKLWYTLGGLSLTLAILALTQGSATKWVVVVPLAAIGWGFCMAGSITAEAKTPGLIPRDPP